MKTMTRRFGALAGHIMHAMNESGFYDDPITIAYGAQELGGLVHEAGQRQVKELLAAAGYTAARFDEELAACTTEKYAYGFGSVQDFLER